MAALKSLDDFIRKTYPRKYHSVFTAVVGPNQSGKTDFNLFILERIHALGLGDAFGTNLKSVQADFEIDFIQDFQTLKKRCQMLNPDPKRQGLKRYFFLASEMGKWAPRDRPWLKQTTELIREFQTVRKYGLSLLGDAISRIDQRILSPDHFHGKYVKFSKDRPDLAIYEDWYNGGRPKLKGIPRTTIDFDTFESPQFFLTPQDAESDQVPLNPEHEIAKKWVELGSWKKAGIHPQQGKRALQAVISYHLKHCVANMPVMEPEEPEPESE